MNTKIVYIDDVAVNVLLAKRRMSKKDLCQLTGINTGNFSVLLRRGRVRPKTAGAIAAALGVDVREILQPEREADHETG